VFRWLMPFCSDLSPYLERENSGFYYRLGGTDKLWAQKARQHFQKQYIPDGWSYDGRGEHMLKDWVPNNERGGTRYYSRVPNTICPVCTWPNGNPTAFFAWEHRTGDVKVSMLQCYFLRVPNDWQPLFEIKQRDKRFLSGTLSAKYSDDSEPEVLSRLQWGRVGSWRQRQRGLDHEGGFFYDGFNLALFVNPIKNGAPSDMQAVEPHDVDWDRVENDERERAEKLKAEKSVLKKGK